jgi:hypothetical protein
MKIIFDDLSRYSETSYLFYNEKLQIGWREISKGKRH